MITLQYYDGFYHTSTWIGHRCICVPLPQSWTPLPGPSPLYSSGLSQSTGFGCPASCIKLALAIYFTYDNVHVSVLFSQIIPTSPSPTESKSLLFTSVSPLHPACRIISTIFLNDISIHFKPITISLAMIVTIHTCHHIAFLLIIFPTLYIYITLCTLLYYIHYLHMTHLFCNWKFAHVNLPHLFLCFCYTLLLENTYLFSVPIIVCFWYVCSFEFFRLYITWNHKIFVFFLSGLFHSE